MWLKSSVETVKTSGCMEAILQLSISHCASLIMVTITKYFSSNHGNIFQTEHFSTLKFAMDWSFLQNFQT